MRRYALISATIVLTVACAAATAQVSRPHVDSNSNYIDAIKIQQYDGFREKSKTLFFAASCGVLSGLAGGEWGATVIVREDALCQPDRPDPDQMLQDIERTRVEGRDLKKQRGCGYWKEHAEEGNELRKYAEIRVTTAVDTSVGNRINCSRLTSTRTMQ